MQKGAGMTPPATVRVTDPQEVQGTIDTTAWPLDGSRAEVPVSLEGGRQVWVLVLLVDTQGLNRPCSCSAWKHLSFPKTQTCYNACRFLFACVFPSHAIVVP
jgi:hypothetical protein